MTNVGWGRPARALLRKLGPWSCVVFAAACVDGSAFEPEVSARALPVLEGDAGCDAGQCGAAPAPLVLLLVDTSGSMLYKPGCTCETTTCAECLPDCGAGERSRFAGVVEALTGTFDDFGCEVLPRTAANGATYDLNYYLPHQHLLGQQLADGVLTEYGDRLRFGLAAFDSRDTYAGAPPLVSFEAFEHEQSAGLDGMWSYNLERDLDFTPLLAADGVPLGQLAYPGTPQAYYMDTGIRGATATDGALLLAADPLSPVDVQATHASIAASMRDIRLYGGSPLAAALDDLYYLMTMDPRMEAERGVGAPKYVVYIGDGRPDQDYRDMGCDCALWGTDPGRCTPWGYWPWGDVPEEYLPERMHCPYPTPEDAARSLRCGRGPTCEGPAERVSMIGYGVDYDVLYRLDEIAYAGGDSGARTASDPAELRALFAALFEEIAAP